MYICVYVRGYLFVCVCVCVYVYIYVCIYIEIYKYYMCSYIYIYICVLNIPIFCAFGWETWLFNRKVGYRSDPDPKWFIPDPDPDPAKSSGSGRIRIRIHNTDEHYKFEWVRLFISRQVQSAYNSVRSSSWEINYII